jgi:adenylate cyclase
VAELFVVDGVAGGTVFFLSGDRVVVGRAPDCQVVLADPWISSHHAALEQRGRELWLVDLSSRNGTWLGGRPVRESRLADGDLVGFGKTTARVRLHAETPAPTLRSVPENATLVRPLEGAVPGARPAGGGTRMFRPGEAPPSADAARRQVAALHAIAKALADARGLEDGLPRILEALSQVVRAERSSLLLMDERGELAPRAHLPPGAPPRHSSTILAAAARDRVGLVTVDAQTDQRFAQAGSVFYENIHSSMCVPIWAEGRVLGMLAFDRRLVEPFTAEDLEVVTAAAYQTALAIERERFLEQGRRTEAQQRRLLLHFSPDVASLILAREEAEHDPLEVQLRDDVTILFSDVRGFTRMTERLPPLELAALLREYFHEMTLAVFEEGGTLDKFIGDGLMAVFGAPVPAPDAAVRAVRCALRMLERLAALDARLPADRRIAIRVGVNTGRVLSGNFGSPERLEYTVLGDAVNVASRLESIAEPDGVYVGRATWEATRHAFRYRELGPQKVKGREAPVEVYQLVGRAGAS